MPMGLKDQCWSQAAPCWIHSVSVSICWPFRRPLGVGRRHPQGRLGMGDALVEQAGLGVARDDQAAAGPLGEGSLPGIQPEIHHPGGRIGTVALEAVVGEDGTNVPLEVDGGRARGGRLGRRVANTQQQRRRHDHNGTRNDPHRLASKKVRFPYFRRFRAKISSPAVRPAPRQWTFSGLMICSRTSMPTCRLQASVKRSNSGPGFPSAMVSPFTLVTGAMP